MWDVCPTPARHSPCLACVRPALVLVLLAGINGAKKTSCAFDFPTKGILQEAVKHVQYWRMKDGAGKPPGLMGWWPSKAVTFVDNHDTGSTQNHWWVAVVMCSL